jgi:hypothetical protein
VLTTGDIRPAGAVTGTVTPADADGPLLVTIVVNVTLVP